MKLYPMTRMLVCTDLSAESDLVLKAAEELRNINNGTIDLLYVSDLGFKFDEILGQSSRPTYRDAFMGDLKASIESKMKDQISRTGIKCNTLIKDGKVSEVVKAISEENQHDLIVMGHGRKPLVHKILGSNANKMISHSVLPVMVIKKTLALNKVAGLIDESRSLDRIIIGSFDFFRNFKCKGITFVSLWMDFPEPFGNPHGRDTEEKVYEEIKHFAKENEKFDVKFGPTKELRLAEPLEKILSKEHVDVVIVKRFSQGNLKRVHIGSTTKQLLEIFDGNILVLPP